MPIRKGVDREGGGDRSSTHAAVRQDSCSKLDSLKDPDGNSVLHNSMIVYGGGNADGNRHTHTNLPIVLAGAGGGSLKPGRYVDMNSKPATNLFLTLADRLGVTGLNRFGDSTGRLSQI